ncbi:tyrosinase family protein [Flavobacterium sp.]|uniref:tyrosinase family protein n=1 Tax=Flavobacterium sp. TaxID=239 RepID=UPI002617675C|nr:tyrosinase family protein [Flavobacterium sp.]
MEANQESRRQFIKSTALALTGVSLGVGTTVLFTGCKDEGIQKASGTRLALRKNIAYLPIDDPEIKLLKDAFKILKKRSQISPLDPSGWEAQSMLHATFCATSIYANQVHYNWYVWPWHRLYLWSMEQKLQKAVGEPTLALHYWDWTKKNTIPEHYWGGADNPLYNPTRLVSAQDEIPTDFINVGATLRASNYQTFGGYPAVKSEKESQIDGMAEQTFHNNIHNWVGGQMATFIESGFDPLFYGHHGNCDRIWTAWQRYSEKNRVPADENWLEKRLYSTDGTGKPIAFTIRELLDNKSLGYDFQDLNLNPNVCNPYTEAQKPIRIPTKADCKAAVNVSDSHDAIFKDYTDNKQQHIMLHFERAQLPYHPYCARVFFEFSQDNQRQSVYSGTFTILPILDLDSFLLQRGVYLQIEADPKIMQALNEKAQIEVVFQPVRLPNRPIPEEPLRLQNITLKKVS